MSCGIPQALAEEGTAGLRFTLRQAFVRLGQLVKRPHKSIQLGVANGTAEMRPSLGQSMPRKFSLLHRINHVTMHEFPTNKRRRKFFFGLPALVFLSLAAIEPIDITGVAETLASMNAESAAAQSAPVTDMPLHCSNPSGNEGIRRLQQIDI